MEKDDKDPIHITLDTISKMTRLEMARLWRFAPPGHAYFDSTKPYFEHFEKRFKELGGFSPEISKELEW